MVCGHAVALSLDLQHLLVLKLRLGAPCRVVVEFGLLSSGTAARSCLLLLLEPVFVAQRGQGGLVHLLDRQAVERLVLQMLVVMIRLRGERSLDVLNLLLDLMALRRIRAQVVHQRLLLRQLLALRRLHGRARVVSCQVLVRWLDIVRLRPVGLLGRLVSVSFRLNCFTSACRRHKFDALDFAWDFLALPDCRGPATQLGLAEVARADAYKSR